MNSFYKAFYALSSAICALIFFSCASIGNPSGGPRDEEPPRFVKANPRQGATNVDKQHIVLEFDELVSVKDAFSKVVVSPSAASTPRVSSSGKKIYIDFNDTLQKNTTYTIDFANAIEDNSEANKLNGFSYSFSTGPDIDSLQISGMVLAARNLEPQQQMVVGVHSILADSAFKKLRLERVAKTNDKGQFTIRGLKKGAYRLFALADANNDFKWDNPEEDIAFTDFTIEPYCEQISVNDTILDIITGKIDTIVKRQRTRFLPNNILLNSFNIDFRQQYLVKNERIDSTRFSLIFNTKASNLPEIKLIDFPEINDWYILEHSANNDTLNYWIRQPQLIHTDTLRASLKYTATDKELNLVEKTDTLNFITIKPRIKEKKKNRKNNHDSISKPEIKFLDMKVLNASGHEIYAPLTIEFGQPIDRINNNAFHLTQLVDTIWKPVKDNYKLIPVDSLSKRKYKIEYPWEYGQKYKLEADSLAVYGLYGNFTKPLSENITIKDRDKYFDLKFNIRSLPDSIPAFVELLNNQDNVMFTRPVIDAQVIFKDVPLGTYFVRLVEDRNGNGIYDTGSFDQHRQPEYVYYFPQALKITKRWDVEQNWDIIATPINLQKPAAVKKNKPDTDKRQRKQNQNGHEDEDNEVFDPTRNPFDPNDKPKRNQYGSGF